MRRENEEQDFPGRQYDAKRPRDDEYYEGRDDGEFQRDPKRQKFNDPEDRHQGGYGGR